MQNDAGRWHGHGDVQEQRRNDADDDELRHADDDALRQHEHDVHGTVGHGHADDEHDDAYANDGHADAVDEVRDGMHHDGRWHDVQNHADGRHEHGHDEELLRPDDEDDERLQHAYDDELQRHADDVLHLLINVFGSGRVSIQPLRIGHHQVGHGLAVGGVAVAVGLVGVEQDRVPRR